MWRRIISQNGHYPTKMSSLPGSSHGRLCPSIGSVVDLLVSEKAQKCRLYLLHLMAGRLCSSIGSVVDLLVREKAPKCRLYLLHLKAGRLCPSIGTVVDLLVREKGPLKSIGPNSCSRDLPNRKNFGRFFSFSSFDRLLYISAFLYFGGFISVPLFHLF